jgi:solute carrier family 35 protein C2
MCKSSQLIFVLLFAFLFRLETFSLRLIGVIFLIFSGVLLMVATETHFVLSGLLLVLSASALGGLRWSLTQLLLKNRKMGMDNPAATIYWLAPASGLTLAIISAAWDNWAAIFRSKFFDGLAVTLNTTLYLIAPGVVAFAMVLSEFYILQRAGVVPMSIAGIAKEVSTITISAWFFGDELTPLNVTGVSITICGIGLFTYHKYRKSVDSPIPLDAHGNPIVPEDDVTGSDNPGREYHVQLYETSHLTSSHYRLSDEPDMDESPSAGNSPELFSAEEEGEEDAEEFRSIRSSKIRWDLKQGNLEDALSAPSANSPNLDARRT